MTNDIIVNLVTPCGARALHRDVDPDKDVRDLSGRDCGNPKVNPTLDR